MQLDDNRLSKYDIFVSVMMMLPFQIFLRIVFFLILYGFSDFFGCILSEISHNI